MRKIILASGSPRRKKLLEQIGIACKVVPNNIEEKLNPRLKPRHQAENLSFQKAENVSRKYKNTLVLAADTIVVLGNEIIGKPKDKTDAMRILKKLSGTTHHVITGYTIIDTTTGKHITDSDQTTVVVKKLSEKEIEAYIKTGEPLDKAGGYGAQEKGAIFIEKIDGNFSNVVGLPLPKVTESLKKFGLHVLDL